MNNDGQTFQLVQQLFQLQQEREHALKIFEEGYKIYIANQPNYNLSKFRQLVNDSTKDFKRISNEFIEVAKKFRLEGYENLGDLILSLQAEEDNRLHLCAKLQMAKLEAHGNPEIAVWNKVAQLKELYNNCILTINEKMEKLRFETDKIHY